MVGVRASTIATNPVATGPTATTYRCRRLPRDLVPLTEAPSAALHQFIAAPTGPASSNGTFRARAGTSACQLAGSMLISINAAVLAFAITIAVQVEDDGSASGETVEVCAPLPVAG